MREAEGDVLRPEACRDEARLKRFVQANISPNAWPIHAPALLRRIREEGLDLRAARDFQMDVPAMERLIRRVHARACRTDALLGIDNAFHRPLHNHEVLLRLLLLEWPEGDALPDAIRDAPLRRYGSLDEITPALVEVLSALVARGVPSAILARDLLAALGHDYGHSGGTDRLTPGGTPEPLTHEETAEKYVAKLGLEAGMPTALVLSSMAGIRATTFHARPGRERIQAANEFERRLTLADVMGCVLPPHLWLTHVGAPVLVEKLPVWRRRMAQIPEEIAAIDARLAALPEDEPSRAGALAERAQLVGEDSRIIKHIEEWFRSERGFFLFIESSRLGVVPRARELWAEALREKISLMERVLERRDLVEPLARRGFPSLEACARSLANTTDLADLVRSGVLGAELSEILAMFLPPRRAP